MIINKINEAEAFKKKSQIKLYPTNEILLKLNKKYKISISF